MSALFRVTYTCVCERSRRVDFSLKTGGKKRLHCPCGRAYVVSGPVVTDVVQDAESKPARALKPAPPPGISKHAKAAIRKATVPLMEPATYSFCESAAAGSLSPWHIRRLSLKGGKYGGGADTPFLCGRVYLNAWDIRAEIDRHNLKDACPECVKIFEAAGGPGVVRGG